MKKFLFALTLLAGLALAHAQSSFTVNLTGGQEVPANGSTGSGSGTLTLNIALNTLSLNNITYSGLSANASAAHIHGPAPAGVATNVLYGFPAGIFTPGTTAGTINGTITLSNLVSGTYTIAQQVTDLQTGKWYVNIHNASFPGGEIRGQILPVPEPSVLALAGLTLGGMALKLRRRKLF